jgi:hypothetical protein
MKIALHTALFVAFCSLIVSCRKQDVDLGAAPVVSIKTGSGYIGDGGTAKVEDVVVIGVTADKNGSPDRLTRLIVRRSINYAETVTVQAYDIPESEGEQYSKDITLKLKTVGKQTYTIIALNAHGLTGETSISFTVVE